MQDEKRFRWLWAGVACAALSATGAAHALEFSGSNLGAIPDNNPAGLDVTFSVSGMTAPVADVSVSMSLTHTWAGDLEATLIAPNGKARRVLFGRLGLTSAANLGTATDFGGVYRFSDRGGDLWAAIGPSVIPSGEYRASTAGMYGDTTKVGGCTAPITLAFDALTTAQLNGVWTLRIADRSSTDVGSISAATLRLLPAGDALFTDGFDGIARGSCVHAQFDYTGSNRTSYVIVRNTGGGANGEVTWFIRDNDGTANGAERSVVLGHASDFFVGGDFDGDNVWDPAVWTAGNPGHYTVKLSSRPANAPPLELDYGKTGDDPKQAGDYDGDGKADFALYRAGANSGDASYMFIRLSNNGSERIIPAGVNGNFASGGTDIDGDGIADIALQSNAGGGVAHFDIRSGVNGVVVNAFNLGAPTDVIVAGNHAGNAQADLTLVRGVSGNVQWTTRDSATGTTQAPVNFGASATDFVLSGDFDGDGLDDYAVWRPSATAGQSKFSIRPSLTPDTPFDVFFGQNGDYPVANGRTH